MFIGIQTDSLSLYARQPKKRSYLALGNRIELYYLVSQLIQLRLSYRQIQQAVLQRKHAWLSKSTISYWARRIHNPLGKVNQFQSGPSPELAYVIGVVLGDGNLNIHGYNAELILAVTDYDFAKEFSASLATILVQPKPYKVRWHPRKNRWVVQGSSILLYNFLSRDWRNLKKWIEHCSRWRAAFLRAFYDAEGSVSGRKLSLHNTKKALLLYIQDLLNQHRVETSRLYLHRSKGTALLDPKSGKVYFRRKDGFSFIVRTKSLPQFAKVIGFSIERKQKRLAEAARGVMERTLISNEAIPHSDSRGL